MFEGLYGTLYNDPIVDCVEELLDSIPSRVGDGIVVSKRYNFNNIEGWLDSTGDCFSKVWENVALWHDSVRHNIQRSLQGKIL